MRIAVTGGRGFLGTAVVDSLATRTSTHIISVDLDGAPGLHRNVQSVQQDVRERVNLAAHLREVDVVVHLAAKHGAHLAAGLSPAACWSANVDVTESVLAAAQMAGVRRFVYVSSTSVFGSGSAAGPARILDESVVVSPEDVYDRAKLACEQMIWNRRLDFRREAVVLRLGRFDFPNEVSHELRKLSTGLDVRDAARAIERCVEAVSFPHFRYCVASGHPLESADRQRLGLSVSDVVERCMPNLARLCEQEDIALPTRVGKSVSSGLLYADLGWRPLHTAEAWASHRLREDGTIWKGRDHATCN
jgi:UDP-glucose 4-epimerase